MGDRVRVAVVGVGAFGQKHLDALAAIAEAEVVVVADPVRAAAEETAAARGFDRVETTLDAVLTHDDVDAVVLATPTQVHAEQAIACLEAGKHVEVEIPLCDNLADGVGELTPESFAELVTMETGGELSSTQTKEVLAEMASTGGSAKDIAAAKGFEAMDTGELDGLLDGLIADNPEEWSRFCGDDEGDAKKMAGFFTGQIMKATRGQADGKVVAQLLNSRKG